LEVLDDGHAGPAPPLAEGLGPAPGQQGHGFYGLSSSALFTSSVSSSRVLRNSRTPRPIAPPTSGSLPGPKMIRTIASRTSNHAGCMPSGILVPPVKGGDASGPASTYEDVSRPTEKSIPTGRARSVLSPDPELGSRL